MGVTDRMITTAVAEGDDAPTIFVLDVRGRPWDGSAGLQLIAEWDGSGMAATQSHAMRLEGIPSVRMAWGGKIEAITRAAGPLVATLFTSVVLGVLDEAVGVARDQIRNRAAQLRPFEQVEWARAEQDHWLAVQAYEGALRAIESGDAAVALRAALRAKESVADLAEQTLLRLTVCSGVARSHGVHRSRTGSRTCARWDSCDRRGVSRTTSCSRRRWSRACGICRHVGAHRRLRLLELVGGADQHDLRAGGSSGDVPRRQVERVPRSELLLPAGGVTHRELAVQHVAPVRALAGVVRQSLEHRGVVGLGVERHEVHRVPVEVGGAFADDAVVGLDRSAGV